MTKKEYNYWKEHVNKLGRLRYIYFTKDLPYTAITTVRLNVYRTSNPDLCYYTKEHKAYKPNIILAFKFENDCIVILEQYEHYYYDGTKRRNLIGSIITNTFPRKYIKAIYF